MLLTGDDASQFVFPQPRGPDVWLPSKQWQTLLAASLLCSQSVAPPLAMSASPKGSSLKPQAQEAPNALGENDGGERSDHDRNQ